MTDVELASWLAGWSPETANRILAEKEWQRRMLTHEFGMNCQLADTIKAWMGATHFLTKGLEHVKAEMSLHVLAYNFRCLIAILGTEKMLAAIRAYVHF